MRQNLSEAISVITLLGALALLPAGCVTRARDSKSVNALPSTSNVQRIDINRASVEELESLPGIGRVIAERIVKHRSQNGNFRRVEHLMLVQGISERKFLEIAPMISAQ